MRRLKHSARLLSAIVIGALTFGGALGCSTDGDEGDTFGEQPGGGGTGSTGPGDLASGGNLVSGGDNSGASSNGGAGGECVGVNAAADAGVDIVWVIDNSGSMSDEIDKIRTNLNDGFLGIIDASNLSWNLIMVSERGNGSNAICVDSPPAGAGCADAPPRFYHVNCDIGSTDALAKLAFSYDGIAPPFAPFPPIFCGDPFSPPIQTWNNFSRINATKVFIIVTDDESMPQAAAFDDWLLNTAQPAGVFGSATDRKYILHGILGMDANNPNATCSSATNGAEEPGLVYQSLAALTGGSVASICEDDWSPIFNDIASSIVTRLSCEYPVPDPPEGQTLNENAVNVLYTPGEGGAEETILRDNTAGCEDGADGWQWNAAKDKILLCGPTCERIKKDPDGKVQIKFGCQTEDVPL